LFPGFIGLIIIARFSLQEASMQNNNNLLLMSQAADGATAS
jgi:hypothetical protein